MKNVFNLKKIIFTLFFAIIFASTAISVEKTVIADTIIDQRARTYKDPVIYKGIGDISLFTLVIKNNQLEIEAFFETPIPESNIYSYFGSIWINSDNNKTTGYAGTKLGADYRVDFTYMGSGASLGELFTWNPNSLVYNFVEYVIVSSDPIGESLKITIPMSSLKIDKYSTIEMGAIYNTRVYDYIFSVVEYDLTDENEIIIDGQPFDWKPEWEKVKETGENLPPFADFNAYYVTNNHTHLFQRFDVEDYMPRELIADITYGGWFQIFYDTDNNGNTGRNINGVGADRMILLSTQRSNEVIGNPSFCYLHKWDENQDDWDWINKTLIRNAFINSTFEFSIPLSQNYLNVSQNTIRILVQQYNADITDSVPNNIWAQRGNFTQYAPPIVEIYDYELSGDRVNVGSNQTILFKTRWDSNTTVQGGILYINKTQYNIDDEGNVKIYISSNEIGKTKYSITGVDVLSIDKFNQTIDSPTIIWDEVTIDIPENYRIDQGKKLSNQFAYYSYDNENFIGEIYTDIAIDEVNIGKYSIKIDDIIDYKYNLTKYRSSDYTVIIDNVLIDLKIEDDRIDIGKWPTIEVAGHYEYDGSPFDGTINIKSPESTNKIFDDVYYVLNITDNYNLTSFRSNEVKCIWDRVKIIEGGLNTNSSQVGKSVEIWISAIYDYDDEIFDDNDGIIYLNYIPMIWSDNKQAWFLNVTSEDSEKAYFVTSIDDNKYGLTQFTSEINSFKIDWIKEESIFKAYYVLIISIPIIIYTIYSKVKI